MNAECRTEVPVNKLISYLVFKSNVNFFFEHSKMYVNNLPYQSSRCRNATIRSFAVLCNGCNELHNVGNMRQYLEVATIICTYVMDT